MTVPQFGAPEPGRSYPNRPAAFVVVKHAGKIALCRVSLPDGRTRIDLPGGGIEPGETPEQAAARECGEEAGLRIAVGELIERADHYFINTKGESNNTRGMFFAARLIDEAPALKVESDHHLVWIDPYEALKTLSRDAHAWAVAAWLRRVRA